MAQNILTKGRSLNVFDTNKDTMESLQSVLSKNEVVKACKSPKAVAETSEIIITMLPNDAQVEKVYLDEQDGLIAGCKKGQLLLDSSTISPSLANHVWRTCKEKQVYFLDTPVSGGHIRSH
jgi:3-hydroxyisobutyrate dehydrogenase-like beta-hydroxyacid dehydrogenase